MLVCLFTASSMMHILLAMLLLSKVSKRVHTHRPQRCRCMGGHEGTSAGHGGHEVCFMGSWGHGAWKGTGHVVLHAHCPVLQPMTAMHTTPEVSHPRHPGPARADLALLHAQGAWGMGHARPAPLPPRAPFIPPLLPPFPPHSPHQTSSGAPSHPPSHRPLQEYPRPATSRPSPVRQRGTSEVAVGGTGGDAGGTRGGTAAHKRGIRRDFGRTYQVRGVPWDPQGPCWGDGLMLGSCRAAQGGARLGCITPPCIVPPPPCTPAWPCAVSCP